MTEYYLIGKIIGAYGDEGFVRIASYSDFPERFFKLNTVYLDFFGTKKKFEVVKVKQIKNLFVLKFLNFNTNKDVELLLNKEIFVDDESLVKLPKDYFFIHDLIGSRVLQNNIEIGIIKDVYQMPGNDVYVIVKDDKEILIPAVKKFIEKFDNLKKELTLTADFDLSEDDED